LATLLEAERLARQEVRYNPIASELVMAMLKREARKISDTSRQGRYHNRRYASLANELGLEVAHLQPIGWSATSVPEPTAARYAEVLAELGAALVLWRRAEQARPGRAGSLP
jgi:hypothetical protein